MRESIFNNQPRTEFYSTSITVHMEQKIPLTAKGNPGRQPEVGDLQDSKSRSSGVLRKKE